MLRSQSVSERHLEFSCLLHAMTAFCRILLLISGRLIVYFVEELQLVMECNRLEKLF